MSFGGHKVLVVVFDGLRPDMVSPGLAPNLHGFLAEGVRFAESRSVFPSATRVNATSMATGVTPAVHGIVANMFHDPRIFPDRLVHTGLAAHLEAGEAAYGGQLVTATAMGDAVARAGGDVAVISTGSGGTTRLLNPRVAKLGHISLCLRDWESSVPAGEAREILAAFGPIPAAARPNTARIDLQTTMFLEHVFPRHEPDLSILWYSDPDSTHHYNGIGTADGRAAIHGVDAAFGRILDWWRGSAWRDRLQVLVASDHGLIVARQSIPAEEEARAIGLAVEEHFGDGAYFAGKMGSTGAIRVRDGDPSRLVHMAEWLLDRPWCGPVFARGAGSIPGVFDLSLAMVGHERAPELYYVMRSDDEVDSNGVTGSALYRSADVPVDGGVHGGLNRREMSNLLGAGGSLFREAYVSPWPAGVIDVAPTVLRILGIDRPPETQGRPLSEGFRDGPEPLEPELREHRATRNGVTRRLNERRVGNTAYIESAWVE